MLKLTRQWEYDANEKHYRVVLKDGKPFGRMYQVRAKFGGHHHPVRLGFKFEFNGAPIQDPIVRRMVREIFEEIERSENKL